MNFFIDFFKGIIIGAGAILPGISSGVLCVVFGIYENLLNCVLNFFKNIKYNTKVLFPIGFGVLIGIFLFGRILKYLFYAYPIYTNIIFIFLILSSIPELIKKATNNRPFKLKYLFFLAFSLILAVSLVIAEDRLHHNTFNLHEFSFPFLIFSGFLMSAGIIIPGVSSTLILMLIGIYDAYLISISNLYIPFLFPLAIGIGFGCYIWMKIIKFLLEKYYAQTFFCIIGFTLGSLVKLILCIL